MTKWVALAPWLQVNCADEKERCAVRSQIKSELSRTRSDLEIRYCGPSATLHQNAPRIEIIAPWYELAEQFASAPTLGKLLIPPFANAAQRWHDGVRSGNDLCSLGAATLCLQASSTVIEPFSIAADQWGYADGRITCRVRPPSAGARVGIHAHENRPDGPLVGAGEGWQERDGSFQIVLEPAQDVPGWKPSTNHAPGLYHFLDEGWLRSLISVAVSPGLLKGSEKVAGQGLARGTEIRGKTRQSEFPLYEDAATEWLKENQQIPNKRACLAKHLITVSEGFKKIGRIQSTIAKSTAERYADKAMNTKATHIHS